MNAPEAPASPRIVDLRGLKCPLPALLFARALKSAKSGEWIAAEATDGLAELDLQSEVLKAGHFVENVSSSDGLVRVLVRIRDGA